MELSNDRIRLCVMLDIAGIGLVGSDFIGVQEHIKLLLLLNGMLTQGWIICFEWTVT